MSTDIETLKNLAQSVLTRALKDENLFKELNDNPKAVLEREADSTIDDDIKVTVHKGIDNNVYIDIKSVKDLARAELTVEDLEHVAGGYVVANFT